MGRRVKDSEIYDAIPRFAGLKARIARSLGVSWATVNNRIKRNKKLTERLNEAREEIVDLAEQKLYEAVSAGEQWAIKCVLYGIGRHRGYSERHEVDATLRTEDAEIRVTFVEPKPRAEGTNEESSN